MTGILPRVVVLGAGSMLGHVVALHLRKTLPDRVLLHARKPTGLGLLDQGLALFDATDAETTMRWLDAACPAVVVNCVARKISSDGAIARDFHYVNSELPHVIAAILDARGGGSRLIQISTDGVFDGRRGNYSEVDKPDATDPYGLAKSRGEVVRNPHLTIRTSIIGHTLSRTSGLLDWFLDSVESVQGFRHCRWSCVTTLPR